MRILIITSKNHPYANYLLGAVLRTSVMENVEILVGEQSALVPGKSTWAGLWHYIRTAGIRYVIVQAFKVYLFRIERFVLSVLGKQTAPFFPYWKQRPVTRTCLDNMKSAETQKVIQAFAPDSILSLFSKEIIPEAVLAMAPSGCWNLHPAKLPTYKGVSPTFWALAENSDEAGVTLHTIDSGIDTGAVIAQSKIPTTGMHTEHELYMRCVAKGVELLITALTALQNETPVQSHPQTGEGSYRSIPTKAAIRTFRANGYRFFGIKQFLSSGVSCKNT